MRDFLALFSFFALIIGPAIIASFTPIDGGEDTGTETTH